MTFETWLAFASVSAVLLVIPGPTILTVIAYASSHGRRATLPLVAAVSLGDLSVIGLSVIGLGGLLAASSSAFTAIKVIGGIYFLILGFKMFISALTPPKPSNKTLKLGDNNSPSSDPMREINSSELSRVQTNRLFFNTWLVTALNPKGLVFFGAFLPQFINISSPIAAQLIILSSTFIFLAAINTLIYAILASKAKELLSSDKAKKTVEIGGASVMTFAGIWTLTSEPST